jgi:hypothetical protein
MTNLRATIAPKSDQLNADDLMSITRTIKVTKVSLCGEAEQPIAINFEGDGGKPYKPCKSMRRVLVTVWGQDGNDYAGRSMTLYRDDKVTFGGLAVGGIRISHMSNIDKEITMALTATRASRKPFTVKPLVQETTTEHPALQLQTVEKHVDAMAEAETSAALETAFKAAIKAANEARDTAARDRFITVKDLRKADLSKTSREVI